MARVKMIYMEDNNYEELQKEDNASALVNKLLEKYFSDRDDKNKTPEEIQKEIEILKIKLEAEEKIDTVRRA